MDFPKELIQGEITFETAFKFASPITHFFLFPNNLMYIIHNCTESIIPVKFTH